MKFCNGFLYHVSASQILELPVGGPVHGVSYKTCLDSFSSQLKTIAPRGTRITYKNTDTMPFFLSCIPYCRSCKKKGHRVTTTDKTYLQDIVIMMSGI